jgi:hypothetical protein
MIYVDDLIIIGNLKEKIILLQVQLANKFKMTNLGQLKHYLGIILILPKKECSCLKDLTLKTYYKCLKWQNAVVLRCLWQKTQDSPQT